MKWLSSSSEVLTWSPENHAGQPAHASLHFDAGTSPDRGAILQAASRAPVNGMKFTSGYTIEVFIKLPSPFEGDQPVQVLSRDALKAERARGHLPSYVA
jgi:hypothetical protein